MAVVISLITLVRRPNRTAAILGLVTSGLTLVFLFGLPVLVQIYQYYIGVMK